MNQFSTLSEALDAARKDGYTASFKIDGDRLRCLETDRMYGPADMTIVNHHRFEGVSNPDDMSVLYLLECSDGTKGAIVDAYGTYAAAGLDEFIKKVPLDERHPER